MSTEALPTSGLLLHLGAGTCTELPGYLEQSCRIVLVEADPAVAEALRGKVARHPLVSVIQGAVAAQSAEAVFYRYNLPGAASLHRASGLSELYPGLQLRESLPVVTEAAAALVRSLGLDDAGGNVLVVDLPGDKVTVELTPYDLSRARIVFRAK